MYVYIYIYILQSQEFDVYINYASTYREAVRVLENIFLKNGEAVEYLKVIGCVNLTTTHFTKHLLLRM